MKYAGTLPIMDPPRSDTASTIANIRGSGVAVKMITGDHLNIAKEMARQIELGTNIMPNTELWPVSAQRDELIHWADGFAQVMPKDKHEVVAVLQQAGLVVGMTGDGVNDAPALAKAQVGVAVAGATDAAQTAADIILTREGLGPIYTAILTSRRIFKRLKAYVVYRICCTVQVVCFLCFLSFVFNEAFSALYIILLALFHDLTIVTIAYDKQTPSAQPETPTVRGLVVQSYAMGLFLAAGSCILFVYGHAFMSEPFVESFKYKEALMFLQITNSSAFLIFSARTPGFFFASTPDSKLAGSAIASQLVVNGLVLFSGGWLVNELRPQDVLLTWLYDLVLLLLLDVVKMGVLEAEALLEGGASRPSGRNAFAGLASCCGLLGGSKRTATSAGRGTRASVSRFQSGSSRLSQANVSGLHKMNSLKNIDALGSPKSQKGALLPGPAIVAARVSGFGNVDEKFDRFLLQRHQ